MFGCRPPSLSCSSDKYQESTISSTSSPSPVGPGCYALVGSQHLSPLHTGSPRVTSTGGDELRAVMITWRAASQRGSVPWYVPIVHETRIVDGGWFTHRLSLPLLCIISICPPASGWHNRHTATSRLFGGMWEKQDATRWTIGQRCWAVIARVDHDWRVKLVVRHRNGRNGPTLRAEFGD